MNSKQKFIEYFSSGAHEQQRVGIELEHFVLKNDGSVLSYYDDGVSGILSGLESKFNKVFYEDDSILGMANDEYSLTLEPGAQLEVSISPMKSAAEISAAFDDFYSAVEPELKKRGAKLAPIPVIDEKLLDTIELIPKKRYEYMDNYFKSSGHFGRYMMRGTTSTQVSVDYSCEMDFIRKFRAAYLLSPLFAAASAGDCNSSDYLKRIKIWQDVDEKRTMAPADLFGDSFGFASYAEYLLHIPAIFIPHSGEFIYTGGESIGSLADRYELNRDMIEHYLSMAFPDVRLKNYIEIRIADSMPKERAAAYGGFAGVIFYNEEILEYVLKRYSGVTVRDIVSAKLAVCGHGLDAEIYGKNAYDEFMRLVELAAKYGCYSDFAAFTEKAVPRRSL